VDQLEWMGRAANRAQRRYHRLRIVMVVGAVVVPALVGLNVRGGVANALLWVTFALGLGRRFGDFARRLCQVADRNLTPSERRQFLPGQPYRETCA
jgi:Protein of unknown function (DUF4231)